MSLFKKLEKNDSIVETTRIYLNIPFKEKDKAKELNCKWDSDKKQWYILSSIVNCDLVVKLYGNNEHKPIKEKK